MTKPFNINKYSIIIEDGQQLLIDKEGNTVPCQLWSRVSDEASENPVALIKLEVNLIESRQKAIKFYK